ncbi:SAF domain-containing protein [Actinoplanes regularis]|uniref:SAF domain-containing protein n=1 Tax=Actinoplanes regularis TaxID=52697 RepID=A0A239EZB9_9ACTN|nr:SAF domain-containing protein [Actinoplanes regularis]SNS49252.1 SAF domain-containing protein [Actinoplanes regularis]
MTVVVESQLATPARPSPSPAIQPKRRWSLLIGGLLSVLLCAGLFAMVQLSGDARVQVLAVARSVAAGQPLSAADLKAVRVVPDPSVPLVKAVQVDQVIGRSPAVPLAPDTLLTESQLGPVAWPAAREAVVAAVFKPGGVPAGLAPGSHALVVAVAKSDVTGATDSTLASAPVAATVVDIAAGADGTGTTVVSLLLTRADAAKLARAGADLSLILVAG